MVRYLHLLIGTILEPERARDERGLSQSTENVILLVGAATIAIIVIGVVRNYIVANLTIPTGP